MKRGAARATVRVRFAALRSFYKFLVHRRGLAASPVAAVQLPKPERKLPVVLTIRQIEELLSLPRQLPLEKQAPAWLPHRDCRDPRVVLLVRAADFRVGGPRRQ